MTRHVGILVGVTLALWLIGVYPASLQWGEATFALSAVAALLCLAPTAASLFWGHWAQEQTPEQQLLMVLGGTGLRMVVVLGVGLTLSTQVEFFKGNNLNPFWAWVLVFYLVTLGLEVALLVVSRNQRAAREHVKLGALTQPRSPE